MHDLFDIPEKVSNIRTLFPFFMSETTTNRQVQADDSQPSTPAPRAQDPNEIITRISTALDENKGKTGGAGCDIEGKHFVLVDGKRVYL